MDPEEESAETQRIAGRLGINSATFVEAASKTHRGAKGLRGVSRLSLLAASVYATCRLFEIPRTLKDVSSASGVETASIARSYRKILQVSDLKMPVQDPARYVSGIASRAGVDALTERRAIGILEAAKRLRVTAGKEPTGVAAAALYAACTELRQPLETIDPGERVTQKDVAAAAGVSEVTVRNRLRSIRYALENEPLPSNPRPASVPA